MTTAANKNIYGVINLAELDVTTEAEVKELKRLLQAAGRRIRHRVYIQLSPDGQQLRFTVKAPQSKE